MTLVLLKAELVWHFLWHRQWRRYSKHWYRPLVAAGAICACQQQPMQCWAPPSFEMPRHEEVKAWICKLWICYHLCGWRALRSGLGHLLIFLKMLGKPCHMRIIVFSSRYPPNLGISQMLDSIQRCFQQQVICFFNRFHLWEFAFWPHFPRELQRENQNYMQRNTLDAIYW